MPCPPLKPVSSSGHCTVVPDTPLPPPTFMSPEPRAARPRLRPRGTTHPTPHFFSRTDFQDGGCSESGVGGALSGEVVVPTGPGQWALCALWASLLSSIHIHAHSHTYIQTSHRFTHSHIYTYQYIHAHTRIHTYVYAYTHSLVYTQTYTLVYTLACTHTCTHTYTDTHIDTHSHALFSIGSHN